MDGGENVLDVLIVGAGPSGLAAAKLLKDARFSVLVLNKGPVGESWIKHPESMKLLSNRDWTSLPGLPITSLDYYPAKEEFLAYLLTYQKVFRIDVNAFETVTGVRRRNGLIAVDTVGTMSGFKQNYLARNLVVATGICSNPKKLKVEGEELPHVHHRYSSAYYYAGRNVAVVGAGNSAAEAVIDLVNVGANVTMMVKDDKLNFYSDTQNLDHIREGSEGKIKEMSRKKIINLILGCKVIEITRENIFYMSGSRKWSLPAEFVLVCVGFEIDYAFVRKIGLAIAADGNLVHDPETLETSKPGIYAVGPMIGGKFIHDYRDHGLKLIKGMSRVKVAT